MTNEKLKEYIDTFDDRYNGNKSIIYPYIKDRLNIYEVWELPFPGEFLFFEERYVKIYKHIKNNKIPCKKIIDIGCQFGFQSEIFKNEYEYIGIDYVKLKFFNANEKNCKYIVGSFPDVELDYKDSVVISSMSLGYFYDKDKEEEYYKNIVEELQKVKYLYIATNRKLINLLSNYFIIEHLDEPIKNEKFDDLYFFNNDIQDVSNNLYFMERKKDI